jgi:hypothetical protein
VAVLVGTKGCNFAIRSFISSSRKVLKLLMKIDDLKHNVITRQIEVVTKDSCLIDVTRAVRFHKSSNALRVVSVLIETAEAIDLSDHEVVGLLRFAENLSDTRVRFTTMIAEVMHNIRRTPR